MSPTPHENMTPATSRVQRDMHDANENQDEPEPGSPMETLQSPTSDSSWTVISTSTPAPAPPLDRTTSSSSTSTTGFTSSHAPSPVSSPSTSAAVAVRMLHCRKMRIPDLWPIFEGWPRARHRIYDPLRETIRARADQLNNPEKRRTILVADPALLASCLWPNAHTDEIAVLAFYVLWQGSLDEALEKMQMQDRHPSRGPWLRSVTCAFFEQCLGFRRGNAALAALPAGLESIVDFEHVGGLISNAYNWRQLWGLKVSLCDYVESTSEEQRFLQSGDMPRFDTYLAVRKRTGGAGPLIALAEYASRTTLPRWVKISTPFIRATDAVRTIIGLTNDLLSLKKEMRQCRAFSAVPVLLKGLGADQLDWAVRYVLWETEFAKRTFESCEVELLRRAMDYGRAEETAAIGKIMETLKYNCTGNLAWSLETERYQLGHATEDGSREVELRAGWF